MKRYIRAFTVAMFFAFAINTFAPVARAMTDCYSAYDSAVSDVNTMLNNCWNDSTVMFYTLVCLPAAAAAYYSASASLEACLGTPLVIGG